ncbi:MAG: hypothetical protein HRU25_05990 [Psychrobium sp.]|nr:hypothetical protein [Psychrobium sp.]
MFDNQELIIKGHWYSLEVENAKGVMLPNNVIKKSSSATQESNFKQSQLTLKLVIATVFRRYLMCISLMQAMAAPLRKIDNLPVMAM